MLEHGGGQIGSDFLSLCAEASEHNFGFPVTNKLV